MLPVNSDNQPEDSCSKIGGAAELRVLDRRDQGRRRVPLAVVATATLACCPRLSRRHPPQNTSLEGLSLQGGRLSGMSQPR